MLADSPIPGERTQLISRQAFYVKLRVIFQARQTADVGICNTEGQGSDKFSIEQAVGVGGLASEVVKGRSKEIERQEEVDETYLIIELNHLNHFTSL